MKKKSDDVEGQKIVLKPMNYKFAEIPIRGITPLLEERNDGTAAELYDGDKSKKVKQRDKRTEEEKLESKIHHTPDGKVGFPSTGFSTGMRKVAYSETKLPGISMRVKEAVRFLEPMIPIKYDKMTVNKEIGRQSGKNRAPRKILRPQFNGWSAILKIKYDVDMISLEQLVDLVNKTGSRRGLGGFRPECSGTFGQYEVVPDEKR